MATFSGFVFGLFSPNRSGETVLGEWEKVGTTISGFSLCPQCLNLQNPGGGSDASDARRLKKQTVNQKTLKNEKTHSSRIFLFGPYGLQPSSPAAGRRRNLRMRRYRVQGGLFRYLRESLCEDLRRDGLFGHLQSCRMQKSRVQGKLQAGKLCKELSGAGLPEITMRNPCLAERYPQHDGF